MALAKERVAIRVMNGGHNIPADVIERRYYKGLDNFNKYIKLADNWYLYDNSETNYETIANKEDGKEKIINFEVYNKIINR